MTKYLIILTLFFGVSVSSVAQDVDGDTVTAPEPQVMVRLRTLDKITARIGEIDAPIDEEIRFGTLAIKARYCRQTPPEEKPETYAYLQISDVKVSGEPTAIYDGWMIASSPAITALEHAVYDVWVIGCKTTEPTVVDG